ncbi:MAG: hypothetical protein ACYSTS_18075 [Planctomycetota bacterium]|jgi:predicted transcriptional regulator
MIQPLENLETKHKVKLTIPLVASYLARGVKRTKIAEICNISNAAVYDYCDRHYEELAPLIDTSDGIMAIKSKYIAEKTQGRLLKHLEHSEKKDLFALNAISGTHIDKYRLLSDKSTANVSIDQITASREELKARKEVLLARLKEIKGAGE